MKFTSLVVRPAGCLLTNLKSANDSYWPGATHCCIFLCIAYVFKKRLEKVTFEKVLISIAIAIINDYYNSK